MVLSTYLATWFGGKSLPTRHPQKYFVIISSLATIFIIHLSQGSVWWPTSCGVERVLCVGVIFCCARDKFEIVSSMQEWLQSNLTCHRREKQRSTWSAFNFWRRKKRRRGVVWISFVTVSLQNGKHYLRQWRKRGEVVEVWIWFPSLYSLDGW